MLLNKLAIKVMKKLHSFDASVFFIFTKLNRKFLQCSILCIKVARNSIVESLQILKVKRSPSIAKVTFYLLASLKSRHSHGCAKLGGNTG